MKEFIASVKQEFSNIWKNRLFLGAFVFIPLVMGALLGTVYSKGTLEHLPIVLVDLDQTPLSSELADMLDDNHRLKTVRHLYESVDIDQVLQETRAAAVVVIPFRFHAKVLTTKYPEVNCYLNMTNTLTAGSAGGAISQCIAKMNAEIAVDRITRMSVPLTTAQAQTEYFGTHVIQLFNPTGNYLLFLWPGLFFSMLHQLLLLGTAVSFSREAPRTLNPHGPFVSILVKITPFVFLSLITLITYFLLSGLFLVPFAKHIGALLVCQLLLVTSTCSLGILFSVIFMNSLKSSQLLMSLASPAFTISGFTWPSSAFPEVVRLLSDAIPLTPFLEALRMLLLQGASFVQVIPHIVHQLSLTIVFFGLSTVVLFWKTDNEKKHTGINEVV